MKFHGAMTFERMRTFLERIDKVVKVWEKRDLRVKTNIKNRLLGYTFKRRSV